MKRNRRRRKYFYSNEELSFTELKWFRLKLLVTIVASVIICLSFLLGINHLYYDFLGLGYNRMTPLMRENRVLKEQLVDITARMKDLEGTLNEINQQGDELRLLVDLPRMEREARSPGIGGALPTPDIELNSDIASKILSEATLTLEKLSSEMSVQQQSYEQILKKHEYNKGYFASIPALKPMEGYYSPKGFGLRMHPVLGIFKTHEGLDIINDVGMPIVAAGDGVVEMAGQSGGGYGNVVVINHGYGYQTLYAHLSKVKVHEGEHVKRGQFIGKSGRSGLVSGPHLHYEIRYKGVRQNPIDYFFDDVSLQDYRKQVASN